MFSRWRRGIFHSIAASPVELFLYPVLLIHLSLLYVSFVPCRGLAVAMKLLDFNLDRTSVCPNNGWRGSDSCLDSSFPVAASLRISGGAMPLRG